MRFAAPATRRPRTHMQRLPAIHDPTHVAGLRGGNREITPHVVRPARTSPPASAGTTPAGIVYGLDHAGAGETGYGKDFEVESSVLADQPSKWQPHTPVPPLPGNRVEEVLRQTPTTDRRMQRIHRHLSQPRLFSRALGLRDRLPGQDPRRDRGLVRPIGGHAAVLAASTAEHPSAAECPRQGHELTRGCSIRKECRRRMHATYRPPPTTAPRPRAMRPSLPRSAGASLPSRAEARNIHEGTR